MSAFARRAASPPFAAPGPETMNDALGRRGAAKAWGVIRQHFQFLKFADTRPRMLAVQRDNNRPG